MLDALAHYVFATVNDLDHIPHEYPPLLSYVWLTGFGYGYARALVRKGAPYSNPEPSQTSTWLCPTVNGMYTSSAEVTGTYRKNASNLS